ncbi:hypothetical protein ACLB2K_035349 [Fragaria x ananassa]
MVRVRPECFSKGPKLQVRSIRPSKILQRAGTNVCVELPLNLEDLLPYKEPVVPSLPFSSEFSPFTPPLPRPNAPKRDLVENTVDEQVVSTRQGGYQKYLIKWKDRPDSDNS